MRERFETLVPCFVSFFGALGRALKIDRILRDTEVTRLTAGVEVIGRGGLKHFRPEGLRG